MPKLATPLTDKPPLNAKPKDKPYKLSDGGGLYLLANPDGAKYWRMDYRIFNTRRTAAFGKYPQVSLLEAREKRSAARKRIDDGIDPVQAKQDAAAALCKSSTRIVNSSPPRRDRVSVWRRHSCIRLAASFSVSSPIACPCHRLP